MKEAVVYVVDSRASQAVSLLDGTSAWDAVQQHVREHVGAVYRQTASSLVSIVVCGTNGTENHLVVQPDEVTDTNSTSTTSKISSHSHQFAHLTELSFGMEKPNVALVRRWRDYAKENINNHLHAHDNYQQIDGTLTDGLRLALQMMKKQTAAKQFRRSVWLYTTTNNHYNYTNNKNNNQNTIYRLLQPKEQFLHELQALDCAVHVVDWQAMQQPTLQQFKLQVHHSQQSVNMQPKKQYSTPKPYPVASRCHPPTSRLLSQSLSQSSPTTNNHNHNNHNINVTDEEEVYKTPNKRIKEELKSSMDTVKSEQKPEPAPSFAVVGVPHDNDDHNNHNDTAWLVTPQERHQFLQLLVQQTNQESSYQSVATLADLFIGQFPVSLETAHVPTLRKDPYFAKSTLSWVPLAKSKSNENPTTEPYSIPVRVSLMHAKQLAPTLKQGVLFFDSDTDDEQDNDDEEPKEGPPHQTSQGPDETMYDNPPAAPKPQRTKDGDLRIGDALKVTRYVQLRKNADADNTDEEEVVYTQDDITHAIPYGSTWQVVDPTFFQATVPPPTLLPRGPVLQIVGCMPRAELDETLVQGPCHVVTGHDSVRSCAAVTAWAQALRETEKVALVLYAKTKSVVATKLGALLPSLHETEDPTRLYLVTLPYEREVKKLVPEEWKEEVDDAQVQAAANLVDALWLSDDQAESILQQPDPFQTALQATVWKRAVEPRFTDLVFPRRLDELDPLGTPMDVRQKAQPSITRFRDAFPLVRKQEQPKKQQGLKSLTYANFVETES